MKVMNIINDTFLKRLNDIRRRRCISIENKALRAMCLGVCGVFIDMNVLQAKLKMGKILNIKNK